MLTLYQHIACMRIANLLLYNKPTHRVVRHLVFWIVYCSYFYIQSLAPREFNEFFISDTYYFAFINLCCFGPVCIIAVYFSIYYLLPKTLARRKYALFLVGFLLLYAVGTVVNYFTAGIFLSNVHYSTPITVNFRHKMEFGNYNTRWGMVIAIIAMGIKLTKTWYLQQKENLHMLKKKTRTEMQLQKARVHPELLLGSLDTIYHHIQSGSQNAPSIILNLSELLSYSLYENEKELVPLEMELQQLYNLIALEQQVIVSRIDMQVSGDIKNKYIVPLVMIKLLEESIAFMRSADDAARCIGLHILCENSRAHVKLFFSAAIDWLFVIENAKKRLSEYYAQSDFGIELSTNDNETVITLHVTLADDPNELHAGAPINAMVVAYDGV
jgi:two-component system, LytTR family, sensor kinase